MTLINRDEHLHQGAVHFILTRWLRGVDDPEMTQIAQEHKGEIYRIFQETRDQEVEWAKFLFKDGTVPLLNVEVLTKYLDHLCDLRLENLGLDRVFKSDGNPLPWMDSYTNSKSVQVAPQEVELSSYKIGSIDMNTELVGLSMDD